MRVANCSTKGFSEETSTTKPPSRSLLNLEIAVGRGELGDAGFHPLLAVDDGFPRVDVGYSTSSKK